MGSKLIGGLAERFLNDKVWIVVLQETKRMESGVATQGCERRLIGEDCDCELENRVKRRSESGVYEFCLQLARAMSSAG